MYPMSFIVPIDAPHRAPLAIDRAQRRPRPKRYVRIERYRPRLVVLHERDFPEIMPIQNDGEGSRISRRGHLLERHARNIDHRQHRYLAGTAVIRSHTLLSLFHCQTVFTVATTPFAPVMVPVTANLPSF
jgi:hypothetical protein